MTHEQLREGVRALVRKMPPDVLAAFADLEKSGQTQAVLQRVFTRLAADEAASRWMDRTLEELMAPALRDMSRAWDAAALAPQSAFH